MKLTVYILCWLFTIIFVSWLILYMGTFFSSGAATMKYLAFGLFIPLLLPLLKIIGWLKLGRIKVPRLFSGWRYQLSLWSLSALLLSLVVSVLLLMVSRHNDFAISVLEAVFVIAGIACLVSLGSTEVKEMRKNTIQRY